MTPFEAWFKRKQNIDSWSCYLRFQKGNLNEARQIYIFIRYIEELKSYHLQKPESKELIIPRGLKFDELEDWRYSMR